MKILMTGATGFIGTPLVRRFLEAGHSVNILSRDAEQAKSKFAHPNLLAFTWKDSRKPPPEECLAGVNGIIHLMGENLTAKRWTAKQKEVLRSSRVDSSHALASLLQSRREELDFFISAGAIGIYAVNTNQRLIESSPVGHTFLAHLCRDWERAAMAVGNVRRKIILRTGVVLGKDGGALQKMLGPFKMGLGGPIGNGNQMISWIDLEDLVELYCQAAIDPRMNGIYNAVAPGALSNFDFTKALGKALHRPTIVPIPTLPLKLALGEMSSVLLDSQNVVPQRLLEQNFPFKYTDIDACLHHVLGDRPA